MNHGSLAKPLFLSLAVTLSGIASASGPSGRTQDLEARYTAHMEETRSKILGSLPEIEAGTREAFLEAHRIEKAAKEEIKAAEARLGEISTAEALVNHAKGKWIGGADRGIAEAKKKLAAATTEEEKKAAEADLAHWEQNRREGEEALEERQAKLDEAEAQRPEIEADLAEATLWGRFHLDRVLPSGGL